MPTAESTKLEAVNTMLAAIGHLPVNTIGSGTALAASQAVQVLNEVDREVQLQGWAFNREKDVTLSKDVNDEIVLPVNILRVDASDPRFDVVEREGKLYDLKNHTFTFTGDVKVDVTYFIDFVDLPEDARRYMTVRAARIFVDRVMGSNARHRFTAIDEQMAKATMLRYNSETRDKTIFSGYAAGRVLARLNPFLR